MGFPEDAALGIEVNICNLCNGKGWYYVTNIKPAKINEPNETEQIRWICGNCYPIENK